MSLLIVTTSLLTALAGIGGYLYARKIGCASIETSTSIRNVLMRSLYERLGFVQMEKLYR